MQLMSHLVASIMTGSSVITTRKIRGKIIENCKSFIITGFRGKYVTLTYTEIKQFLTHFKFL